MPQATWVEVPPQKVKTEVKRLWSSFENVITLKIVGRPFCKTDFLWKGKKSLKSLLFFILRQSPHDPASCLAFVLFCFFFFKEKPQSIWELKQSRWPQPGENRFIIIGSVISALWESPVYCNFRVKEMDGELCANNTHFPGKAGYLEFCILEAGPPDEPCFPPAF